MNRVALVTCLLLCGCFDKDFPLGGDSSCGDPLGCDSSNSVLVCVQGDVGHCCQDLYDGPTVGCMDSAGKCGPLLVDDAGVDCAGRATCTQQFERTPSRCIYCQRWSIDDGGVNAMTEPFAPPPNPPAGTGQTAPGGSDDEDGGTLFVAVCGQATYM